MKPVPIKIHALDGLVCPECGKSMNKSAAADGGNTEPWTGDISLCYECGAICLYDRELQLVKPTEEELKSIRNDSETWFFIGACQQAIHQKRLRIITEEEE